MSSKMVPWAGGTARAEASVEVNQVFGRVDYPHDLSHELSERTVYMPSASLCCYDQKRAIHHRITGY
jgi:hypothetical protein